MRLTRPTIIVFLISLICGVLALLAVRIAHATHNNVLASLISLPISAFWLMTVAWGLLTAGVLLRGL